MPRLAQTGPGGLLAYNRWPRSGKTHACVRTNRTGFCWGEVAGFDRILDNSITDYGGGVASIDIAGVFVVDTSATEQA